MLLSSCAPPGHHRAARRVRPNPSRDLAAPARVVPADQVATEGQSAAPADGGASAGGSGGGANKSGAPSGSGGAATSLAPGHAPFHTVLTTSDPAGDARPTSPGYADPIGLSVADDGITSRFTVTMAAAIPGRLADGESEGVGIDIWRQGSNTSADSDMQLFADGGVDGWFAYLQTKGGFVQYPGRLTLDGTKLTFDVQWSDLESIKSGSVRAFADWSKRGVLPVNLYGEDHAPDAGPAAFRR